MNSKERLLAAINGQKTDRVPVAPFVMAFAAKYAGVPYGEYCRDHRRMAEAQIKTVIDFDYDILNADTDAYREAEACGAVLNFQQDGLPLELAPALKEKSSLLKLKLPDLESSPRMLDKINGVEMLKRELGDSYPVLGWVEAPFQSASLLRNINNFMLDIYEDPSFLENLLEFTTEMAVMYGKAQAKAGADIIGIGDAVASLVSPNIFLTYVLPYTQRVVKGLQTVGVKVKYHICGNSSHLLEHIAQIGADIVNIDSAVDLRKARDILNKCCLKGNIDPVGDLVNSTPEKIQEIVQSDLNFGGDRYILSPGCEVPAETPYENFRAMINAVRQ